MRYDKKIFRIAVALFAVVASEACTGNFDKINRPPYDAIKDEMTRDDYALRAAVTGMQNFVIPTQVHLYQFHEVLAADAFAGYTACTPQWTTKFSTYNPPTDWYRAPFNDVISGVYPNWELMKSFSEDDVVLALGKLFRVAAMHRITDTYGPIPYSKMSAAGGSSQSLSAPYDSQEEVYTRMMTELDEVITVLTDNRFADPAAYRNLDNVYDGDILKWARFANTLKLRMAIRIAYVKSSVAKTAAEEVAASVVGTLATNGDNALLKVTENPLEMQVIQWGDERAGADIVSYMNGYADPRIAKYFTVSTFRTPTVVAGAPASEGFHGLRSGIDVSNKDVMTRYSMPIVAVTDPIMWMNAAEAAFLKAEGALRGWNMGGTAEQFYTQGVELSFAQWGVSSAAVTYLADAVSTPAPYVDPLGNYTYGGTGSSITIKWDDAAGFEANLERIITQKWIANFPLGNESWAEFRRTGYPRLMPVVLNKSGGAIPTGEFIRRLNFPDTEYKENTDNIYKAVGLLGGPDSQGTKLWWDKK
ncbi:MAG: SusD/RagB family nutrient-binding outer membrane lipoprotein [Rikenellaceae bacterium]|jgi:hypothetical protein|nr:SusD/RagB family nutrient-binding outer membrane lipoprotein [Rikenellaceae bacterium]